MCTLKLELDMMVHTLIPELRRQRPEVLCEFKTSLAYTVSSRLAKATYLEPVSKIN